MERSKFIRKSVNENKGGFKMKIQVYTTIDESWDSGDLNSTEIKYFISKELRDDYFENILKLNYSSNEYLEEYVPNRFCEKTGRQRWSYIIEKGEDELEIIEEKNW